MDRRDIQCSTRHVGDGQTKDPAAQRSTQLSTLGVSSTQQTMDTAAATARYDTATTRIMTMNAPVPPDRLTIRESC